MLLLELISTVLSMITMTTLVLFLCFVIFLASMGKSIGVRRMYVDLLVKVFEYGRQNIEIVRKQQFAHLDISDNNTSHTQKEGESSLTNGPTVSKEIKLNGGTDKTLLNGDATKTGNSVISRVESLILVPDVNSTRSKNRESDPEDENDSFEFNLSNCLDYVKSGIEAIIEDEVTSRFEAEELKNWNLLTRTNRHYEFISWRLTIIWVIGFFIRYVILMPSRVFICFIGVVYCVVGFAIVGIIPKRNLRLKANEYVFKHTFRIICRSLSAVIRFHNKEYKPKNCGFCVANHTTPIDIAILSTDHSYSLIGQRHGGFLGVLQRALARASPHIWFERAEAKDRMAVAKRLKEHVSDPNNPPILIFPEGTCINNTSVMQFKKGSFEVGGVIYPVAIKYDARFGDAFWNSSRYSMMQYLYMMMTSWAIVCDVWYLPSMTRGENESAINFANRVKSVIAKQGGLVDLVWDGQLKRMKPKKEWKEKQQEEFSKRLKGE
ncbi:glycerol-3-phosphate acyltransferase 3 isoform X1 [Topomyia yanbarensis]|uniref:glycerol-3-phosphate acyltransferase 3 isoform X1 n=1 Tax=Topomyia yanbarensis TaxID=2498891 RepID=UPI00273CC01D|nr:glycerol-3-phosphate acyltransferase 3 isoform X1 [Topomyia yanbarensis]